MITVTIITKNEKQNLETLLPLLTSQHNLVSEIVVVDSGSTDGTLEVAERYSARVAFREFAGYGPQKQFATSLAKNNWILNLDADEFPAEDFWVGLRVFFKDFTQEPKEKCATITREFVFLGKVLRFGGASQQKRKRLFDKRYFDWNSAIVHEDVVLLKEHQLAKHLVGSISGKVLHYSWQSVAHWLDATNRRSTEQSRMQRALISNPQKQQSLIILKIMVISRFFLEFVRSYFLRLGILDGVEGFVFCFLMAFSQEIKYIKYYESQKKI